MELNVAQELANLRRMTPAELRVKYGEAFGEPSRSGHRDWLIKRIIWRLQALSEGDLSELPMPGTMIVRQYKGKLLEVHVLVDGFAYQGEVYRTLTAVAQAVTGSHANGFLFFRMGKYGGGR